MFRQGDVLLKKISNLPTLIGGHSFSILFGLALLLCSYWCTGPGFLYLDSTDPRWRLVGWLYFGLVVTFVHFAVSLFIFNDLFKGFRVLFLGESIL